MPISNPAPSQIEDRPRLAQMSTLPSYPTENKAIDRVKQQRKADVDDRDRACGTVVAFLDGLAVDEQRQRDDAFCPDKENDAELVRGEQEAEATAGKQGRRCRGKNDGPYNAPRFRAKAARHLDLACFQL